MTSASSNRRPAKNIMRRLRHAISIVRNRNPSVLNFHAFTLLVVRQEVYQSLTKAICRAISGYLSRQYIQRVRRSISPTSCLQPLHPGTAHRSINKKGNYVTANVLSQAWETYGAGCSSVDRRRRS